MDSFKQLQHRSSLNNRDEQRKQLQQHPNLNDRDILFR